MQWKVNFSAKVAFLTMFWFQIKVKSTGGLDKLSLWVIFLHFHLVYKMVQQQMWLFKGIYSYYVLQHVFKSSSTLQHVSFSVVHLLKQLSFIHWSWYYSKRHSFLFLHKRFPLSKMWELVVLSPLFVNTSFYNISHYERKSLFFCHRKTLFSYSFKMITTITYFLVYMQNAFNFSFSCPFPVALFTFPFTFFLNNYYILYCEWRGQAVLASSWIMQLLDITLF